MESSKIKSSKVGEFSFWSTHYSWQSFDLDMDGAFPSGVRANLLLALMLASARRQDCTKSKSAPWNCMVVVTAESTVSPVVVIHVVIIRVIIIRVVIICVIIIRVVTTTTIIITTI